MHKTELQTYPKYCLLQLLVLIKGKNGKIQTFINNSFITIFRKIITSINMLCIRHLWLVICKLG